MGGPIGAFIETVYNADRLHSALGYAPPIAFEENFRKTEKLNREAVTAWSIKPHCTGALQAFRGKSQIWK